MTQQILQYDHEIERAILDIFVNYREFQEDLIIQLKKHHFSSTSANESRHQRIFRLARECYFENNALDMTLLHLKLDSVDWSYFIDKICETVFTGVNYETYLNKLTELHQKRQLAYVLNDSINNLKNLKVSEVKLKIDEIVDGVQAKVQYKTMQELAQLYGTKEYFEKKRESILKLGYEKLNNNLILSDTDLIIIAGRTGDAKTTLSLNFAVNLALQNKAVGFLSTEMGCDELFEKLALMNPNSEAIEISDKYLTGVEYIQNLPIMIQDTGGYDLSVIDRILKTMIVRNNLQCLFIDYLTLLNLPDKQNQNLSVAAMTKGLKQLCMKYKRPIFLLSQLNRKTEDRASKRPQLYDLRDSGAIEQDANKVLFCYRPFLRSEKNSDVPGILVDMRAAGINTENENMLNLYKQDYFELYCAKQRNGITFRTPLCFKQEKQRFYDWSVVLRDELPF